MRSERGDEAVAPFGDKSTVENVDVRVLSFAKCYDRFRNTASSNSWNIIGYLIHVALTVALFLENMMFQIHEMVPPNCHQAGQDFSTD